MHFIPFNCQFMFLKRICHQKIVVHFSCIKSVNCCVFSCALWNHNSHISHSPNTFIHAVFVCIGWEWFVFEGNSNAILISWLLLNTLICVLMIDDEKVLKCRFPICAVFCGGLKTWHRPIESAVWCCVCVYRLNKHCSIDENVIFFGCFVIFSQKRNKYISNELNGR